MPAPLTQERTGGIPNSRNVKPMLFLGVLGTQHRDWHSAGLNKYFLKAGVLNARDGSWGGGRGEKEEKSGERKARKGEEGEVKEQMNVL